MSELGKSFVTLAILSSAGMLLTVRNKHLTSPTKAIQYILSHSKCRFWASWVLSVSLLCYPQIVAEWLQPLQASCPDMAPFSLRKMGWGWGGVFRFLGFLFKNKENFPRSHHLMPADLGSGLAHFLFIGGCLLMAEETRELPWATFIRTLVPFMRASPS